MLLMVPLAIIASRQFADRKAFLLSPFCVFVFAWAASAAAYLTGTDFLRARTIVALASFYVAFIAGAGYVLIRFPRVAVINRSVAIAPRPHFLRTMLILQGLAFFAALAHLYFAFVQSQYTLDLTTIRGVLATKHIQEPVLVGLLGQLRYINYVSPIAFYAAYRAGATTRRALIASSVLACLYPLCYLERSGVLRIGMLLIFAHLYYSVDSFKRVLRFGAVAILVFIPVVVAVPLLRGQAEGVNAYNYVSGAWSGFDNFVTGSLGPVVVLEKQNIYVEPDGYHLTDSAAPPLSLTFSDLYRICDALKVCQVKQSNFFEYVYEPIYTNIYTLARTFFQDFGMFGAPVAAALCGALLTFAYLWGISRNGAFPTYVAAYTAYVCAMSVLSDNFLMRDIALTGILVGTIGWWFGSQPFCFGIARNDRCATAPAYNSAERAR